jgi:hypothetical protein
VQEARGGWGGDGQVCTCAVVLVFNSDSYRILECRDERGKRKRRERCSPCEGVEIGVDLPGAVVEVGVPVRSVSVRSLLSGTPDSGELGPGSLHI